jgi:hypothetical protein
MVKQPLQVAVVAGEPGLVTMTSLRPAAALDIVMVVVIFVGVIVRVPSVMPPEGAEKETVEPLTKPEPLIVKGTVAAVRALAVGLTEVTENAAATVVPVLFELSTPFQLAPHFGVYV